jgi:hypothetical protein
MKPVSPIGVKEGKTLMGQCHEIIHPGFFFHKTTTPGALINYLK